MHPILKGWKENTWKRGGRKKRKVHQVLNPSFFGPRGKGKQKKASGCPSMGLLMGEGRKGLDSKKGRKSFLASSALPTTREGGGRMAQIFFLGL